MTILTKDETWTCPATEDDPDTPSTCASPWVSEGNPASDSVSVSSNGTWSRQISEASSDSISSENWHGLIHQALDISGDQDGSQSEIEFHSSHSVKRDPMEEAGSPEKNMANNIALRRTKLCRFHQQGLCKMGPSCRFAHDQGELQSRPNLFRTNLCFAFSRGHCKLGDTCNYAHGPEQLHGKSYQDPDQTTAFQVSRSHTAKQGDSDTKAMRLEIARALLAPSRSSVTDVGTAIGVKITVKNTFVHFSACKLLGRRRSVSCER